MRGILSALICIPLCCLARRVHFPAASSDDAPESLAVLLTSSKPSNAFSPGSSLSAAKSRREFGRTLAGIAVGAAASAVVPSHAKAETPVKIYFGAGCFWHVQHEFIMEEMAFGRSGATLTAVSGYAGGTRAGGEQDGAVCYHNRKGFADYGKLGHAEVVQLEIPESSVPRFAKKYFSLFGNLGIRHDPGDQGGEYRSALGLPGGANSPLYPAIQKAADESAGKLQLVSGTGNEDDTFFQKRVFVYDSDKLPFYPGEIYHQFHNDFQGPAYGQAYNELQKTFLNAKKLLGTGCPDRLPQGYFG